MDVPANQVEQGRLSGTATTNQRNNLPFIDVKIDTVQNRNNPLPPSFANLKMVTQIDRLDHGFCHLGHPFMLLGRAVDQSPKPYSKRRIASCQTPVEELFK